MISRRSYMYLLTITCFHLLLLCVCFSPAEIRGESVWDMSTSRNIRRIFPESTVMMRTLKMRNVGVDGEIHDTMQALDDFHVDGLVWAYLYSSNDVQRVKETGRFVQLATGGTLENIRLFSNADNAVSAGQVKQIATQYAMVDINGNAAIPPWKRNWGNTFPTMSGNIFSPLFKKAYVQLLQEMVTSGADSIQRDDPSLYSYTAMHLGGGFSDDAMDAFRRWLEKNKSSKELAALGIKNIHSFDYRDYLRSVHAPVGDGFASWDGGRLKAEFGRFFEESEAAFYPEIRGLLDKAVGHHVVFSCNNGTREFDSPLFQAFDWYFGELSDRSGYANPSHLYTACQKARSLGKVQVMTMPKRGEDRYNKDLDGWERHTKQTIATAYAAGGFCIVPWDIYMFGQIKVGDHLENTPRYFGRPDQYANTFAFIKAIAPFLDGYTAVFTTGKGLDGKAVSSAPVRIMGNPDISAVVRVIPGQKDTPVAVHLIDWGSSPEGFSVCIDPLSFSPDRALRVKLLTPLDHYVKADHDTAQQSGNYSAMVHESILSEGRQTIFSIPPLKHPWAILVLESIADSDRRPWAPLLEPVSSTESEPKLLVRLRSGGLTGGRLYYTTNGVAPDETSQVFNKPFALTDTAVVKAVEFCAGKSGADSSYTFRKIASINTMNDPGRMQGVVLHFRASETRWISAKKAYQTLAGPALQTQPGHPETVPKLESDSVGKTVFLRFDGNDDRLFIPEFFNRKLAGRGFTVIMVSRSSSPQFGIGGNNLNGQGGVPRLYLRQNGFIYNKLDLVRSGEQRRMDDDAFIAEAAASASLPFSIYTFYHDGEQRISMFKNGKCTDSREANPPVKEFGSGGNLCIPMIQSTDQAAPGNIAEIIVFNRPLSGDELSGIHEFLKRKYGIGSELWR